MATVATRSRLWLVFPPPMQPEILRGVLADQFFQGRGVALGQQPRVFGGAGELSGLDDLGAADLVAKAGADASRDADDHGCLVLDSQQCDGLVRRGRPAEELHEHPPLPGVLVRQH